MMTNKRLIEPGSHNILIHSDLKGFRESYSQYSRALLPQNETILIGTQYDTVDDVKNALRLADVAVERYLNQGILLVVDAQQGY
jgi:hypothetical protein